MKMYAIYQKGLGKIAREYIDTRDGLIAGRYMYIRESELPVVISRFGDACTFLPEAEEKYFAWSPLYHAEKISVPLAIFQGDKDGVVPKEQSEGLLSRLKVPHVFRLYEGEGHGFRRPDHIRDYLMTLHQFLQQYL